MALESITAVHVLFFKVKHSPCCEEDPTTTQRQMALYQLPGGAVQFQQCKTPPISLRHTNKL